MAKRKRRRQHHPPNNDHHDLRSVLLQPLCRRFAHNLLAEAQQLGAVEAVVMVMIPTADGGADISRCYAHPLEQGGPSELMLNTVSFEVESTLKELTGG